MNAGLTVLMIMVSLLLFAVAIGVALFIVQRILVPDPTPTKERLSRIKNKQKLVDDYIQNEVSRKLASIVKGSDYQNIHLERLLDRYTYIQKLKRNIAQAGMKIPVDQYFLKWFMVPPLVGLLLAALSKFIPLALLGILVPVGAHFYVLFQKGKRLKKFTLQFPDALNLMTSSLRAGHSFQSCLTVVASELQDPIGTEFSSVVKDFNLGIPVREALERLLVSMDGLSDIRMFTTAVLIQRESGGNLAEVLDKLSLTIRERFKLKGQISSMTAQSRLTGYCLGAAPLLVVLALSVIAPDYLKPMFEETIGKIALFIAFIMQMAGFLIIKRIVDIRV